MHCIELWSCGDASVDDTYFWYFGILVFRYSDIYWYFVVPYLSDWLLELDRFSFSVIHIVIWTFAPWFIN